MVSLKLVEQSNAALRSAGSGKIALFVGGTSGLGLTTLNEYVRCADRPKVYLVGRSKSKLSNIIADLEKVNPDGSYVPIQSEIELFKNVDAACAEFQRQEKHLDLLVLSPGFLKATRQPDTADGVEPTLSLRYYVRARFAQQLLPQLLAAPAARIVSIHAAGKEGVLNESDLLLQRTYSMRAAAMHTGTMNSLALEALAADHPTLSCVHVFPGVVVTPAWDVMAEDWAAPLRWLFRWTVVPLLHLIAVGVAESGKRHVFHATSARYPPSGVSERGAGVPTPEGVKVAPGADGKEGSGCYLIDWDGEAVKNGKLMADYRKKDWGKKIWEHTQEVFDNGAK